MLDVEGHVALATAAPTSNYRRDRRSGDREIGRSGGEETGVQEFKRFVSGFEQRTSS
jgi:hypothetical protein